MKIMLAQPARADYIGGYAEICRGMQPIQDTSDRLEADVMLWCSPPYSFQPMKGKFNVAITMCERHKLNTYSFNFIGKCNHMNLLLVPSVWCKRVFEVNGIKAPIEVLQLGHNHRRWESTVNDRKNERALVVDRGRDHRGSMNELGKYFSEIRYMDCRTPYKMKPGAEWLKKGNFTPAELQAAYAETDVFFKWGREGWGFPLLEAMSAGALVITNCVHLPYLEDRKNCLQFRDAPALQRVLNLASRQKLTEIKREGQKTAKSLTWGKAVAEARKLIEASMK